MVEKTGWKDGIQILITPDEIQSKVAELGRIITNDYKGCELVLVGVLKGCVPFMADLGRNIDLPITFDYLEVASYGWELKTTGVVRLTKDLKQPIVGKHVLVVEDIVDTGLTVRFLLNNLETRQPLSLNICVLLDKPARRISSVPLRYYGFVVPNVFMVGYGLDYQGRFRNLNFIGTIDQPL